ncbi:MAG TPA: hypothetical protein VHT21_15665 [Stellaceae bacterium]|nr:hypothetical protein [Stellaceae bacterium]
MPAHRANAPAAPADEQRQGGAAADSTRAGTRQREDQADQDRTQGLPDEPRGGENAGRLLTTAPAAAKPAPPR